LKQRQAIFSCSRDWQISHRATACTIFIITLFFSSSASTRSCSLFAIYLNAAVSRSIAIKIDEDIELKKSSMICGKE
jgi:hypothetical protein